MRPKERRDSGQKDLFLARLDQIVDNSGKFGIGTTSPARLLEVAGTSNYGQIYVTNTSANEQAGILFKSADDTRARTDKVVGLGAAS